MRRWDGALNIGVGSEELWSKFCVTMGRPEWLQDPRFSTNRTAS
jgi:crotonobetainyl-CoA:carnitine CoA-transferase CaiB-like acyl-CoA transferase